MIQWWIRLWDRRERGSSLAIVRILLGSVVFLDLLIVARLDLVVPLYAPLDLGGLGDVLARTPVPLLYQLMPATLATAHVTFWLALAAAAMLAMGLFSRFASVSLLLLLAQLAQLVPASDRGIDMLIRNALMVLAFSRCGAVWSVDAWLRRRRTGQVAPPIPSWPRYLLVIQLVLLYGSAGVQKVSSAWLPPTWSALYLAVRDPHFGRGPLLWLDDVYWLTQLGTAVTWVWECSAPLILLAFWYRDTADRPGRLRSAFQRFGFLHWTLALGALFHVGTFAVLRLGIFPFAVLSLYPACVHPDELARAGRRLRLCFHRPSPEPPQS